MRRISVAFPLLLVLLLGLVATGLAPAARAQDDATPVAEDEDLPLPEGITIEFLAYGTTTDLAGVGELALFRFIFEPGASFPIEPDDPSVALVVTEQGEITIVVDTAVTVFRAPEPGQFPTDFDEVAADESFTLAVGDSALIPGNVAGEVRNDGDTEAVLLVSNILPSEDEPSDGASDTADDAAGDVAGGDAGDLGDGDATPSTGDTADPSASTVAVEIVDFSFRSKTLEIPVGTTVTWTNSDTVPHTATADDGSFDTGTLSKGESFSVTFDEPGTYTYECTFHTAMKGTIVVT